MKRILAAFIVLFVLTAGSLSAQAKTSLNIQCNVTGAKVYLNDNLAGYTSPNFSSLVAPGLYVVRVAKDGYPEYRTTVVVGQNPVTLVANFGHTPTTTIPIPPPPPRYTLRVNSDVDDAQVFIDGRAIGQTPLTTSLPSGEYTVTLRAWGYQDFVQTVRLHGTYSLYARMQPQDYPVFIDAPNVQNAQVYRGSQLMGSTPYRGTWPQGNYVVRIVAQGYAEYLDAISLKGPYTAQVMMTPLRVDYEIRLPDTFSFSSGKPGNSWKEYEFYFYLDGERIDSPYGSTVVGQHTLTLYVGGLRLETRFDVAFGKRVVIEPFLSARVY